MNDIVIGFDIREMWLDTVTLHSKAMRETYLLKDDAEKPLSVDTTVWPSIFDVRRTVPDFRIPGWAGWLHGAARPADAGSPFPLWHDLVAMKRFTELHLPKTPGPICVVAITTLAAKKQPYPASRPASGALEASNFLSAVPAMPKKDWAFLGYDIANPFLLSGLMNCGYTAAEKNLISTEWAGHLNQHHLFYDEISAVCFRDITCDRVPEHAPFFVFGLWILQGLPSEGLP